MSPSCSEVTRARVTAQGAENAHIGGVYAYGVGVMAVQSLGEVG